MQTGEWVGIFCIGLVFGYLLCYAVKHTPKFDITLLSAAIGAIGGQAVVGSLGKVTGWIYPYGLGVGIGFVVYLLLSLFLILKGGNQRVPLVKTMLGKEIEK